MSRLNWIFAKKEFFETKNKFTNEHVPSNWIGPFSWTK